MDLKRLKQICKSIDRHNYDDLLQDTYIRLNGKHTFDEKYYYLFYVTAKNLYLNQQKKKKIVTTSLELTKEPEQLDDYDPSIYKKALDKFLLSNNNTIFADVIELYLICPNITKMSKHIGIPRLKLHRILENAKNGIGIEYLRIASNIDSDNDIVV